MELLPPPLFANIVGFAVPDYNHDIVPTTSELRPTKRKLPVDALQPLSLVSKAWNALITELVSRQQLATFTLQISTASRTELLEIRRRLSDHGAKVQDLRVVLGKEVRRSPFFGRRGFSGWTEPHDDFNVDWNSLFNLLPAVQRLDLGGVPLMSKHVQQILTSAAKFCSNVEVLVLSGVEEEELVRVDFDALFTEVYAAMQVWRDGGKKKGLRQITVPEIGQRDRFQYCKRFFENVVKHCPDVEFIDGYKLTLCELDKLTCRDDWMISLEQWETFNATCTQLREFHWVVAPFGDPFFQVFGQHVKPQLKKLTLAVNMLWEWDAYFEECKIGAGVAPDTARRALDEYFDRPGYGFRATDVSSVLKGCPALDDLEIEVYHPADGDEFGFEEQEDLEDFPDEEMLNIDIFDDRFCETLATHCPMLSSLSIWEVAEGQNSHLTPIQTFTDRGLLALAQLKYLSNMQLRTVNCTGKGVFEFLNHLSDDFTGERTFQICLGGSPDDSRLAFYNALTKLLTKLSETRPQNVLFSSRNFVLRLMNSHFGSVEPNWSKSYLRRVERLVKTVKQKHPSLRLRITTSGRRGKTFESIIELGLYTDQAKPSPWYGWDDEESDRNVTFVNRGDREYEEERHHRLPLELRHPELMDPDSLPIDYELPADYFDEYGGYDDYDDFDDYGDDGDDFYDGNADELWE